MSRAYTGPIVADAGGFDMAAFSLPLALRSKWFFGRHRFIFPVAAVALLLCAAIASAADSRKALSGHQVPMPGASVKLGVGAAGDSEQLSLTIVLKRDDEAGFQRFLRDLQDPRAASY